MSQTALPPATPSETGRSRSMQVKRLLTAVVAGACLYGVYWGFNQSQAPVSTLPQEIEALSPVPQAQNVPSQSTISVDMKFGEQGALIVGTPGSGVGNVEIPKDQTSYVRATGELSFTPGDGKELTRLPIGPMSVTVVYWPETGTREKDAREFTWTFDVT